MLEGLLNFLFYYATIHVVVFIFGFLDIVRIPHIMVYSEWFKLLHMQFFKTNFSFFYNLKMLLRQTKNLVIYTLVAPLWIVEEIIFYNYRTAELPKMVFIICTPRTGSTNLHRTMAKDERVLAPTLTDFLVPLIFLKRLGEKIGYPKLNETFLEANIRFLNGNYNDIHRFHNTGVSVVEELGTLTLSQWFNEMIMPPYFHPELLLHTPIESLSPYLKERILDFMERTVRKWVYGSRKEETVVLLKGIEPFLWDIKKLEERFPGSKFITLTRDPKKQICSRYSFYEAQQETSHGYKMDKKLWGKVISDRTRIGVEPVMEYFYRNPEPNRLALTFTEFVSDLDKTYEKIYDFIGLDYVGTPFQETVKKSIEEHKKI